LSLSCEKYSQGKAGTSSQRSEYAKGPNAQICNIKGKGYNGKGRPEQKRLTQFGQKKFKAENKKLGGADGGGTTKRAEKDQTQLFSKAIVKKA